MNDTMCKFRIGYNSAKTCLNQAIQVGLLIEITSEMVMQLNDVTSWPKFNK